MSAPLQNACAVLVGLPLSKKGHHKLLYHDIVRSAASGCTLCCILRDAPGPLLEAGAEVADTANVWVTLLDHGLGVRYDDGQEIEVFNEKGKNNVVSRIDPTNVGSSVMHTDRVYR